MEEIALGSILNQEILPPVGEMPISANQLNPPSSLSHRLTQMSILTEIHQVKYIKTKLAKWGHNLILTRWIAKEMEVVNKIEIIKHYKILI